MVVATMLWGGTFVVIRDSLHGLDPGAIVFGRFALAGALLAGWLALRRVRPTRAVLLAGAISGLLFSACYLLQSVGLQHTSAGTSAFLTCAGSLTAGLFAWPLLRQRPGPAVWAGLALALAGSALLSLDDSLRLGPGEAITLLGALSFAAGIAWVGRLDGRFDPVALAAVQCLTMAAVMAPAAPRALGQFAQLSAAGWGRFGYLALAGSLAAPLLTLVAQRSLPPARIGLLLGLEPVFATMFAVTFGGEQFFGRWWWGAALILFAVALVEWRARAESR